jgi:starch-binding outer membrane protein, SusD/RagB family
MKLINQTYRNSLYKVFGNLCIVSFVILGSCKKFVVADPPVNSLGSAAVFSTDVSAVAAMTSVYMNMKNTTAGITAGGQSIGFLTGMESDELKNYNTGNNEYVQFYSNEINSQNTLVQSAWNEIYQQIHVVNVVLENLDKSSGITSGVVQQIRGEAKFMRAFLHFYAVNLFGKIPLVLSSDYRVNNVLSRSDIADVYTQVIKDLKEAQSDLTEGIVDGLGATATTRVRPNKWAATALLARVYLYNSEWANAQAEAAKFSGSTVYTFDNDFNNTFTITSREAIWQLQAIRTFLGNLDGIYYILSSDPGSTFSPVTLSPQLEEAFEPGDARYNNWVGKFTSNGVDYFYPFKYKVGIENLEALEHTMVLRLAEQYLILAEAKIQQGNISDGIADLNVLRQHSRLAPTVDVPDPLPALPTNLSKEDALKAVMHERQVELFTEWGHRWLDLKRTGEINTTMEDVAPAKNSTWNNYQSLWPIPATEINLNAKLTQNEGYN